MIGRGPAGPENRLQLGRRILESIPTTRRGDVSELLATMFPAFAKNQEIQIFRYRGETRILSGRRISDPNGFDAYFRFAPVADEISVDQLRQVAERIDDEDFLVWSIQDAMARKRLDGTSFMGTLLEHLPRVLGCLNETGPALLKAILKMGDQIIEIRDETAGFFRVNNQLRLGPILVRIFELTDPHSVREAVEAAVDDSQFEVGGVAYVIAYTGADHGLVWERSSEARLQPFLLRSDVERIGTKLSRKIEELARSNTLQITLTTDIVLRVWKTFGSKDEVRAWIERNLCDPTNFAKIAFSQMGEVSSSSPPYRFRQLRGTIDKELFDLRKMLHWARKHQASQALETKDREDLGRFINGLENLIPDDKP